MKTWSVTTESSLRRWFYLGLTIVGSILPWICFEPFLFSGTASIHEFFAQALVNPISTLFVIDLTVSGIAFLGFAWFELKRLGYAQSWLWLYVVCMFAIGVSCAFPLFLYLRERKL